MRVETLLPLGKLDPGLRASSSPLDLRRVGVGAALEGAAVGGTYDEIGKKLIDRYGGLITDVEFSIPAGTEGERSRLRELVQDIQRAS